MIKVLEDIPWGYLPLAIVIGMVIGAVLGAIVGFTVAIVHVTFGSRRNKPWPKTLDLPEELDEDEPDEAVRKAYISHKARIARWRAAQEQVANREAAVNCIRSADKK